MKNSQRGLAKREVTLGVIFVLLGFFCALYFFKYYTRTKQNTATIIPLPTVQQQKTKSLQEKQEVKSKDSLEEHFDIISEGVQHEETEPVKQEHLVQGNVPNLILNGVFASETGNYALINNRVVRVGDTILGVKVKEIYLEKVVLDASGKEVILRME
ncbi:MAG: type II secretion system protein N [Candidatus Omnitrophota bacterium]